MFIKCDNIGLFCLLLDSKEIASKFSSLSVCWTSVIYFYHFKEGNNEQSKLWIELRQDQRASFSYLVLTWSGVFVTFLLSNNMIDSHLPTYGEGNGNPLQCSCLENPRDRGAWWAAISGVTQSRTRLKWLSSLTTNEFSWNHFANCNSVI